MQRRVGFEAELQVPSLGPPADRLEFLTDPARATAPVRSFLDGGVAYGTDIGGKSEVAAGTSDFRLDADHNKGVSRQDIVRHLEKAGHVRGKPYEPRTNLEYVTRPVDELAKGSDKELAAMKTAVTQHMATTLQHARDGKIHPLKPPAKPGYFTGVPTQQIDDWLGAHRRRSMLGQIGHGVRDVHGSTMAKAPEPVVPKLDEYRSTAVADRIYLQATVGVVPSSLRGFMAQVAGDGAADSPVRVDAPSKGRKQLIGAVDETINRLSQQRWFQIELDRISPTFEIHKEAFLGLLWLCYSYIVADALHQTSAGTSSTAKNAVPFLIKHAEKGGMRKTLKSSGFRPSQQLMTAIGQFFTASKYAQVSYWTGKGDDSAVGQGKLKKRLKARPKPGKDRIINGSYTAFVTQMFRDDMSDTVPYLESGDMLKHDDPVSDVDGLPFLLRFQTAIPLEYRWIRGRYTVASLPAAIDRIVDDVRNANLSEMSEERRQQVIKATK